MIIWYLKNDNNLHVKWVIKFSTCKLQATNTATVILGIIFPLKLLTDKF